MTLTGPVAYMIDYPADPFAAEYRKNFNFYSDKDGQIFLEPRPGRQG